MRRNPTDPRRRRARRSFDPSDPQAVAGLIQERLRQEVIWPGDVQLAAVFAEPLVYRTKTSFHGVLRKPLKAWKRSFSANQAQILANFEGVRPGPFKATSPQTLEYLDLPIDPTRSWPSSRFPTDGMTLILAPFSQNDVIYKACRSVVKKRWRSIDWKQIREELLFYGIDMGWAETEPADERVGPMLYEQYEHDSGATAGLPDGRTIVELYLQAHPQVPRPPAITANYIEFGDWLWAESACWWVREQAAARWGDDDSSCEASRWLLANARRLDPTWYLAMIYAQDMSAWDGWYALNGALYLHQDNLVEPRGYYSVDQLRELHLVENRILSRLLGGPPL